MCTWSCQREHIMGMEALRLLWLNFRAAAQATKEPWMSMTKR